MNSQRSVNPLAAFAHCLVGQADQIETRQPRRDLALHLNPARFKAEVGNRLDQCNQACPRLKRVSPGDGPAKPPCRGGQAIVEVTPL